MLRKLVVMVMAVLFSLSVSGLGFAAEEKKPAAPATPAAEKAAPAQPCAGAEKPKKSTKKKSKKKVAKKEEGATMAPKEYGHVPDKK
jgi:hypothetical protein